MSRRVAAVVCLLGVTAAVWWWRPGDERHVQRRIHAMAQALTARPGESDLERLTRISRLASGLTPDIVVTLDDTRRIDGREAVLGLARQIASSRQGLRVEARDVTVRVETAGSHAQASLLLVVDGESYHDVGLDLVRPDDVWLIREARVEPSLARPGIRSR